MSNSEPVLSDYFTQKEAAAELKVTERTLDAPTDGAAETTTTSPLTKRQIRDIRA